MTRANEKRVLRERRQARAVKQGMQRAYATGPMTGTLDYDRDRASAWLAGPHWPALRPRGRA